VAGSCIDGSGLADTWEMYMIDGSGLAALHGSYTGGSGTLAAKLKLY
jgi:hypothetical protein